MFHSTSYIVALMFAGKRVLLRSSNNIMANDLLPVHDDVLEADIQRLKSRLSTNRGVNGYNNKNVRAARLVTTLRLIFTWRHPTEKPVNFSKLQTLCWTKFQTLKLLIYFMYNFVFCIHVYFGRLDHVSHTFNNFVCQGFS